MSDPDRRLLERLFPGPYTQHRNLVAAAPSGGNKVRYECIVLILNFMIPRH